MSSVVPLRSSSCQSPDLVLPRPFPSVLTTRAFDHSRRRWFGTCSCQLVPRGPPSSIKQLHTLGPPRPFALVAHGHQRSACISPGSWHITTAVSRPFRSRVRLTGRARSASRSSARSSGTPTGKKPRHLRCSNWKTDQGGLQYSLSYL